MSTTQSLAETREFNVGDTIWWATCGTEEVTKPCPICFGKRVVTLILGNDEQVQTHCDFCGKGFDGPLGYLQEYEWRSAVKEVRITGKQVNEMDGNRDVEYRYGSYVLLPDNIFTNKEDAEARVLELIAKHEAEENDRMTYRKEHNKKSYSWHVGYHKRRAKEARRELEYHEKKAVSLKELSKPQ